ncbi:ACT domain-containing protein [Maridesulfovibrio bastinii]|jgi:hypothetical protein|uniref:ACT domain-containing protein n=1 Tax=Maridesulfovibrio bastinii TaxID=47157 RepID=UPI0003FA54F4|nr:ACT domain-containing protein [Maridesulfovibrio bastinii]
MKCDQLSIFLENRAGRLAEVTRLLSESKVNIRALSLADTSDFGILRLIVSDFEKAQKVLKDAGFTVGKTSVVAVVVDDHPGGLHNLLHLLRDSGINVEYMYAFVQQSGSNAVIIFRFDKTEQAIELLTEKKIKMIPGNELSQL